MQLGCDGGDQHCGVRSQKLLQWRYVRPQCETANKKLGIINLISWDRSLPRCSCTSSWRPSWRLCGRIRSFATQRSRTFRPRSAMPPKQSCSPTSPLPRYIAQSNPFAWLAAILCKFQHFANSAPSGSRVRPGMAWVPLLKKFAVDVCHDVMRQCELRAWCRWTKFPIVGWQIKHCGAGEECSKSALAHLLPQTCVRVSPVPDKYSGQGREGKGYGRKGGAPSIDMQDVMLKRSIRTHARWAVAGDL